MCKEQGSIRRAVYRVYIVFHLNYHCNPEHNLLLNFFIIIIIYNIVSCIGPLIIKISGERLVYAHEKSL